MEISHGRHGHRGDGSRGRGKEEDIEEKEDVARDDRELAFGVHLVGFHQFELCRARPPPVGQRTSGR